MYWGEGGGKKESACSQSQARKDNCVLGVELLRWSGVARSIGRHGLEFANGFEELERTNGLAQAPQGMTNERNKVMMTHLWSQSCSTEASHAIQPPRSGQWQEAWRGQLRACRRRGL